MVNGIATVWVPVTDMDRAVAYYRDVLGLSLKSQSEDWSELETDGLVIGLNARESATSSDGGGAVISFQPDGSIEDERDELTSRGGELTGEISEHPWGRILPFGDSEGNDLQLYSPPAD
ncbi:hypothetical protein HN031_09070 [Nocardioides sp. zg-1308]|uniref:VOC family protein n=1 Tax=Nocardioides sp. zg-1308 TaxID=2736253 RepID=UPI0015572F45|nr:VOC family protein [Nocardioides sp. zg-1308]NPD04830.1 hypothetical protein [Nocardioides sp. zg-1308]